MKLGPRSAYPFCPRTHAARATLSDFAVTNVPAVIRGSGVKRAAGRRLHAVINTGLDEPDTYRLATRPVGPHDRDAAEFFVKDVLEVIEARPAPPDAATGTHRAESNRRIAGPLPASAPRPSGPNGRRSSSPASKPRRRSIATRRCATRRVTRATKPVANDVVDDVAVRPMIAPTAMVTAKSKTLNSARMRRSESRSPMTATVNSNNAFSAVHPSSVAAEQVRHGCLLHVVISRLPRRLSRSARPVGVDPFEQERSAGRDAQHDQGQPIPLPLV